MDKVKLFLFKNDTTDNDKLPYFSIKLVPPEGSDDWKEIGALWKAKSGKGYSGFLNEGVTIDVSGMKEWKKKDND